MRLFHLYLTLGNPSSVLVSVASVYMYSRTMITSVLVSVASVYMYSRTMITSVGRVSYSSSEGYKQVSRGLWCCFHVPINVLDASRLNKVDILF